MKACFFANMYFNEKFSSDVEGVEEIKKTAGTRGCQQPPTFFMPIRYETKGQSRGKQTVFFIRLLATLVKFSLCFRPGKVSL